MNFIKTKRISLKALVCLFLWLGINSSVFAQGHSISGIVTDGTDEPLIGVSVVVKGTTNGTSTDVNGRYVLDNVGINSTFVFSYVGYITQEISYRGNQNR